MSYHGVEAFLNNMAVLLEKHMYVFSTLSILLNVFHILILSRKSMTASAVTSLLIGIAVVDIISPIYYIETGIRDLILTGACTPPHGYIESVFNWILLAIRDDLRRCSTWFGLDLAAIRMVSLKLAFNKRFDFITKAPFGRKVMFVTFLLSCSISIFYFFRYHVVVDTNWKPIYGCDYKSAIEYIVDEVDGDLEAPGHAREVHLILTAVFEKILPSILFPIAAAGLIWELRKAKKLVTGAHGGAKSSNSVKSTEKTNKLVIYMTITFIVIELPIGVCKLITATRDSYEEAIASESITKLLNMAYIPLTATHCLICFSMSSQYRTTARRFLRLDKKSVGVQAVSSVALKTSEV